MWMAIGSRVPFGKVKPKWDFHKSGYWLDPNFPWENPRKISLFLFQMLWIRVETVWPAGGQTHGSLSKIQPCADSCRTLKQLYWKDCFYQATSFTTSHSAGKHDLTGALEIHQQCLETFLDCSHRPLCMSRRFMRPWCRFLDLKRIMTAPRNKTRYCFFSICCQFNWNNIVTCLPSEFV